MTSDPPPVPHENVSPNAGPPPHDLPQHSSEPLDEGVAAWNGVNNGHAAEVIGDHAGVPHVVWNNADASDTHLPPAVFPPASETGSDETESEPVVLKHRSSSLAIVREVVETIVLAALIFLAVRAVVQNFKVEGSSMVPNFIDGEYVLVNKAVYTRIDLSSVAKVLPLVHPGSQPEHYIFHGPQRGDVIVFHPPPAAGGDKKDFIKRVVGAPGDIIDFRAGHVLVNGKEVIEPYITASTVCQGQFCHYSLQANQYYVLGDNRTNSSDSRFWGPVSADKVIGKTLLIYWCGGVQCQHPTDHMGLAPNHTPILVTPSTRTP